MNTAIILGSGPAGLLAARRLADRGYAVAVIGGDDGRGEIHPAVRRYAKARLLSLQGASGDFTASVGEADNGQSPATLRAGAVILTPDYYENMTGGLPAVAGLLGIALNDYGLVAVHQFCPVLTTRAGIFAVGGGSRTPSSADLAAQADTAASLAAQILGEEGGIVP